MSGPYIYKPSGAKAQPAAQEAAATPSVYTQPFFQPDRSPFIPQLAPLTPLPGPAPFIPGGTPFIPPMTLDVPQWGYEPPPPMSNRPRSWNAADFTGLPAGFVPLATTPAVSGIYLPNVSPRGRSMSLSAPQQTPSWYTSQLGQPLQPWAYVPPSVPGVAPRPMILHPMLDGTIQKRGWEFDLSSTKFDPLKLDPYGRKAALTQVDLEEPATYPAITAMTIINDALKQFGAVEIKLPGSDSIGLGLEVPAWAQLADAEHPPIKLVDVLVAIHQFLHTQIGHVDWAKTNQSTQHAIGRAYGRRCAAQGELTDQEASEGIKRIDYLLDRYMFKGLTKAPGSVGFEAMVLNTGK